MSKRGVSSYHDDTPSWYNGYVWKIKDQRRKSQQTAFIVPRWDLSCGMIVQSPSPRKTINRDILLHNSVLWKVFKSPRSKEEEQVEQVMSLRNFPHKGRGSSSARHLSHWYA
jgi:hypothetical protein